MRVHNIYFMKQMQAKNRQSEESTSKNEDNDKPRSSSRPKKQKNKIDIIFLTEVFFSRKYFVFIFCVSLSLLLLA